MKYFIYRVDRPGTAALRKSTRAAHLAFADIHRDRIVMAGPTLAEDGETMNASVWIIEADSPEEAATITEKDPYERAGLFETKIIRPFLQVMPEKKTSERLKESASWHIGWLNRNPVPGPGTIM